VGAQRALRLAVNLAFDHGEILTDKLSDPFFWPFAVLSDSAQYFEPSACITKFLVNRAVHPLSGLDVIIVLV
jgi:hypothetical protein